MKAVLVRHTSLAAPQGLCYGRIDVPLAEDFPGESAAVRASLPWLPELVLTSPAERCRRLAGVLAPAGVPLLADERLAELAMGAWEGRAWDDLKGPEVDAWMTDPWHARPPGGETVDELLARVGAVRRELQAPGLVRAVLVTHAGVIRAWRSLAERRPLAALMEMRVPFGSVWSAD